MLLVQNRREGIPHGTFLKGSILAQSQALHFFLEQANYIVLEDNKSSSPVLWFAFASLTMSLVLASQMSSCCLPRLLSVCRIDSSKLEQSNNKKKKMCLCLLVLLLELNFPCVRLRFVQFHSYFISV